MIAFKTTELDLTLPGLPPSIRHSPLSMEAMLVEYLTYRLPQTAAGSVSAAPHSYRRVSRAHLC